MANNSCNQETLDRAIAILAETRKKVLHTSCATIYNKGLKAFRRAAPVSTPLSCKQQIEAFEIAARASGVVQECLRNTEGREGQKPFVEVTPGAAKAKGRVMLSEYVCDDLELPLVVTRHKDVASAKHVAAKNPDLCHRIHAVDEF